MQANLVLCQLNLWWERNKVSKKLVLVKFCFYNTLMHRMKWYTVLIHWGRVTYICVGNLTIIGSDNGLSPGRRQAIIWTNAGILLIRTLGTNFSEILGEIDSFSFSEMHLKMSSAKWRLFGLGLNVFTPILSVADYWHGGVITSIVFYMV